MLPAVNPDGELRWRYALIIEGNRASNYSKAKPAKALRMINRLTTESGVFRRTWRRVAFKLSPV